MVKAKAKSKIVAKSAGTAQTWSDAKNALLLVSVLINAFIIIGWAVLKLTNQYDTVLSSALLGR